MQTLKVFAAISDGFLTETSDKKRRFFPEKTFRVLTETS
jgi:hypothetical protein